MGIFIGREGKNSGVRIGEPPVLGDIASSMEALRDSGKANKSRKPVTENGMLLQCHCI